MKVVYKKRLLLKLISSSLSLTIILGNFPLRASNLFDELRQSRARRASSCNVNDIQRSESQSHPQPILPGQTGKPSNKENESKPAGGQSFSVTPRNNGMRVTIPLDRVNVPFQRVPMKLTFSDGSTKGELGWLERSPGTDNVWTPISRYDGNRGVKRVDYQLNGQWFTAEKKTGARAPSDTASSVTPSATRELKEPAKKEIVGQVSNVSPAATHAVAEGPEVDTMKVIQEGKKMGLELKPEDVKVSADGKFAYAYLKAGEAIDVQTKEGTSGRLEANGDRAVAVKFDLETGRVTGVAVNPDAVQPNGESLRSLLPDKDIYNQEGGLWLTHDASNKVVVTDDGGLNASGVQGAKPNAGMVAGEAKKLSAEASKTENPSPQKQNQSAGVDKPIPMDNGGFPTMLIPTLVSSILSAGRVPSSKAPEETAAAQSIPAANDPKAPEAQAAPKSVPSASVSKAPSATANPTVRPAPAQPARPAPATEANPAPATAQGSAPSAPDQQGNTRVAPSQPGSTANQPSTPEQQFLRSFEVFGQALKSGDNNRIGIAHAQLDNAIQALPQMDQSDLSSAFTVFRGMYQGNIPYDNGQLMAAVGTIRRALTATGLRAGVTGNSPSQVAMDPKPAQPSVSEVTPEPGKQQNPSAGGNSTPQHQPAGAPATPEVKAGSPVATAQVPESAAPPVEPAPNSSQPTPASQAPAPATIAGEQPTGAQGHQHAPAPAVQPAVAQRGQTFGEMALGPDFNGDNNDIGITHAQLLTNAGNMRKNDVRSPLMNTAVTAAKQNGYELGKHYSVQTKGNTTFLLFNNGVKTTAGKEITGNSGYVIAFTSSRQGIQKTTYMNEATYRNHFPDSSLQSPTHIFVSQFNPSRRQSEIFRPLPYTPDLLRELINANR
ncbi:MAG: hypothetical protein LHV69_07790 [Elusimicrobia bacterium]|nr:hypothetical protein [Candidatus Obscuribacterium magneticum]